MGNLSLPVSAIVAGGGVLLVLFLVWRAGARRARGARLVSLAGRVVVNAALIVAAQWAVISTSGDWRVVLAVLVPPALFASYSLTRALTITAVELDPSQRQRGRR